MVQLKLILSSITRFCSILLIGTACSTLEQASTHGLNSGFYKLKYIGQNTQKVYVDVGEEKLDVYKQANKKPDKTAFLSIPLKPTDSTKLSKVVFKKQSFDFDITSVLFKYRPSVYGLSPQFTSDFNLAVYSGWRKDMYFVKSKKDPLGYNHHKITSQGYDFGFFAGPGTTLISPFTTRNKRTDEYSALIMQTGIAGFVELNLASFGLAVGFDYLMNADRKVWIYQNKPWVGFMVGIALN